MLSMKGMTLMPTSDEGIISIEYYYKENGGVIFPNPNAPTGVLETLSTVEAIIKANSDVIVIVDEAYIDFGGESALSLLDAYDNLFSSNRKKHTVSGKTSRAEHLFSFPVLCRNHITAGKKMQQKK